MAVPRSNDLPDLRAFLRQATVRICSAADNRTFGAGFLVGDCCRYVLTCAHVIHLIGHKKDDPYQEKAPEGLVTLNWPNSDTLYAKARVACWEPPAPDSRGDIAGLVIESGDSPPQGTHTLKMDFRFEVPDADFISLGFLAEPGPGVHVKGKIQGEEARQRIKLLCDPGDYSIVPGFSGAAVWAKALEKVIGMVVEAETNENVPVGFMTPAFLLQDAHRKLTGQQPEAVVLPPVKTTLQDALERAKGIQVVFGRSRVAPAIYAQCHTELEQIRRTLQALPRRTGASAYIDSAVERTQEMQRMVAAFLSICQPQAGEPESAKRRRENEQNNIYQAAGYLIDILSGLQKTPAGK